ncbi:MAG: hypothetical protein K2I22_04980 [Lachnospiraceae bacterium]|nr:hypothetical protein [Lachnospiraceae bacterium]
MYLYHYYDKTTGPFRNLSDLPVEQAKSVLEIIKTTKPNSQGAQRHDKYVEYRRNCERIIRTEFAKKGGQISRVAPHYMVVEHSPWLSSWFENCDFIKIPIEEFDILEIIDKYGLPQDWNDDGKYGPERYIEVHVWSDETIKRYGYK